jgi:integrase
MLMDRIYPGLAKQWLDENASTLRTETTRRSYRTVLQLFDSSVRKSAGLVTESDLVAFLNVPGRSSSTVVQYRKVLRGFFSWAHWREIIPKDPSAGLKRVVPVKARASKVHRWLDSDEVRLLLKSCDGPELIDQRDRVAIMVGLFTGLRRQEIANLTWDDVHLNGTNTVSVVGKGEKPALVGLPQVLAAALTVWHQSAQAGAYQAQPVLPRFRSIMDWSVDPGGLQAPVFKFQPEWGMPLCGQALYDIISRRSEAAGIGHVAPHDLRRTFAGLLEERGVGIEDISRALRHSNVAVTQRYLEANPKRTTAIGQSFTFDL